MRRTMVGYLYDLEDRLKNTKYLISIVMKNGEKSYVGVSKGSILLKERQSEASTLSRDSASRALDYIDNMFDRDEYTCYVTELFNNEGY